MTRLEYLRARPLPPQPRLPADGVYLAVVTDDGGIYPDLSDAGSHYHLVKAAGIPPERVVDAGYLEDGDFRSSGSMVMDQIRQEAAVRRVEHKHAVIRALKAGEPVPEKVLADYPELARLRRIAGRIVANPADELPRGSNRRPPRRRAGQGPGRLRPRRLPDERPPPEGRGPRPARRPRRRRRYDANSRWRPPPSLRRGT